MTRLRAVKALDTSVLVRYYTAHGPCQAKIAARVIAGEAELFIPRTVLIELYLLLKYAKKYTFAPARIGEMLKHLIDLPNLTGRFVTAYPLSYTSVRSSRSAGPMRTPSGVR